MFLSQILNLSDEVTRGFWALFFSLFISIILGPIFIRFARRQLVSGPRAFTPQTHLLKRQTPSMGGVLIIFATLLTLLCFGRLDRLEIWLVVLNISIFGLIGLIDDLAKLRKKAGISAASKFGLQLLGAGVVVVSWLKFADPSTAIILPIFCQYQLNLGPICFAFWAILIILSVSNAVNLTDGLDGLAATSLVINFLTFGFIILVLGHCNLISGCPYPASNLTELVVVCAALAGSCLGFLYYNHYPAQIFMGDVGSVALGATLALIALFCKQELILLLTGGIFVLETLSVILQVLHFKIRGKKIFLMAPIHHHFELKGLAERKITFYFSMASMILALIVLGLLVCFCSCDLN